MRIHAKTKYLNEPADIEFGQYSDGSLAMIMQAIDFPEPLASPTVNLVEFGLKPNYGEVFIKDYSESEGWFACLVDQGVIEANPHEVIQLPPHDVRVIRAMLTLNARAAVRQQIQSENEAINRGG